MRPSWSTGRSTFISASCGRSSGTIRRAPGTSRPSAGSGTSSSEAVVRDSLLWRLLGAQWLVIAIAVAISGAALSHQVAHTFMAIMVRYHVDPTTFEAEFRAAGIRILLVSSLVAAAIAMLLGWVLVTRIVRPLEQMMVLAERIAMGDYARRLERHGRDEIGRLAESLNQMAASLQRTEAFRRELVANVAHELRTPLSTLQGYLEALRDGVAPPSPETLAMLHGEVIRLARLVGDLQQLSHFEYMCPSSHSRVVERVYRGDNSRSRETGGAGIELAIVQEISRAHGVETGASSVAGLTTVWFSLPQRAGAGRVRTAS